MASALLSCVLVVALFGWWGQASPGPLASHSLVYDGRLGRVVLISSRSTVESAAAEVWTFDGRRWEVAQQPGPPARFLGSAVYDSARDRIVVFGGRSGRTTKDDTWEGTVSTWHQATGAGPGLREHHAMAYDSRRGRAVMFGGTSPIKEGATPQQTVRAWPSDTYEWDGTRWMKGADDGPGARNGPAMAYDAARQLVLLFGGVGKDGVYRSGTWAWDGRAWRQLVSDGPPLRASHQMVYDSQTRVVWMYGGGNQTGRLQDMWKWDGARWTEVTLMGPTPGVRNGHAMAYDEARQRVVLHGGFGAGPALDDTWLWDSARWTRVE